MKFDFVYYGEPSITFQRKKTSLPNKLDVLKPNPI